MADGPITGRFDRVPPGFRVHVEGRRVIATRSDEPRLPPRVVLASAR